MNGTYTENNILCNIDIKVEQFEEDSLQYASQCMENIFVRRKSEGKNKKATLKIQLDIQNDIQKKAPYIGNPNINSNENLINSIIQSNNAENVKIKIEQKIEASVETNVTESIQNDIKNIVHDANPKTEHFNYTEKDPLDPTDKAQEGKDMILICRIVLIL